MSLGETSFERPLAALGQLLAERGLHFELLVVGGGALQLLGLITRPTRDIDVVAVIESGQPAAVAAVPEPLESAINDTGAIFHLPPGWFNAGPRALIELGLPEGILARAHLREWGALAVDQGPRSKHFADLQRLEPTADELRAAAAWARTHDPSEGFHQELRGALRDLGVRDGDV